MPSSLPPYALAVPSFPFPALAALAGRAPLGGAREAALAALLVARLAATVTGAPPIDPAGRAERATAARQWLSGVSLPPATRTALGRAVDAIGQGASPGIVRVALDAAVSAVSPLLDPPARQELQQLLAGLADAAPT